MSGKRKELQEALCRYTTDTLSYIDTVRGFCERISTWTLKMEIEMISMVDIKDRADSMNLKLSDVQQVKKNLEAIKEYIKSKMTLKSADSKRAELVKELDDALTDALRCLKELDCFLDAVEKLAVTSLHVFMEDNQVLHLPKGISLKQVQDIITDVRLICPLLLEFKRDASVFFLPKLQNVEVLSYQLDRYIQTTQIICDKLEKSCISDFDLKTTKETVVELDEDLSEDDEKMLCHINQLHELRMNQHFRTVFLFHEVSCSDFIREFSERQPRMLQFLKDLEETAVQLDKMNKGAKISSVTGSSVGAVGGVLSIVGLALLPVTAGVSVGLIIGGAAMGVTSGVNSAVTTVTEIGVNRTQQKKANGFFQSFMEDVQVLQDCLEKVTSQIITKIETSQLDVAVGGLKVLNKVRGVVVKCMDSVADVASAGKLLKTEELISSTSMVGQEATALRNVSKVASDIPDIGQAAVKGSLAVSKTAIVFNALFIGMDVFFICKDSISLAKGSETELSQFIRARAALWSSQIDSWQKMFNSLIEGLLTSEKHRADLDKTFYPEREMKNNGKFDLIKWMTWMTDVALWCMFTVRDKLQGAFRLWSNSRA